MADSPSSFISETVVCDSGAVFFVCTKKVPRYSAAGVSEMNCKQVIKVICLSIKAAGEIDYSLRMLTDFELK